METLEKERPILFSAPMIHALLAGRKTQTRRALSNKLIINDEPGRYKFHYYGECDGTTGLGACFEDLRPEITPWISPIACPYGEPGDRLWVREPWNTLAISDSLKPSELVPDAMIRYEADGALAGREDLQKGYLYGPLGLGRYRNARFMPRQFSRILLEIKAIRCEQVQHISIADVRAEGCDVRQFNLLFMDAAEQKRAYTDTYGDLWVSINGPESWCANPWVWVVEFERVTP